LGYFYVAQGDLPTAIWLLEQGCALVERWDLSRLGRFAASLLGLAHALEGRSAEAVPFLERAEAQLNPEKGAYETRLAIPLCEGFLLAGRLEQAIRLADRALNASKKRRERGYEAQARRLLGGIAARRDPPDAEEAECRYREAQTLAEELGMRPLQAHCHLGLGRLHRRTGRAHEARVELSAAVEMLRAMEMTFWLPEAEAELSRATA
jgi:tetratricopeptide (TPR) repeat protein